MNKNTSPEYSMLAQVYDAVMDDVNYEIWADFIDAVIQQHHPDPVSILELACGTGSLALSLDELMCYDIIATDKSRHMIDIARRKADQAEAQARFRVMDFLDIKLDQKFDIVLSTFDSVNYLHGTSRILQLFEEVKNVLSQNGLFIFDFTTPKNSIQAIEYLNNEEGYTSDNHYRFFRKSSYDPTNRIHYNAFNIEELDDDHETVLKRYREIHEQKIYTLQEMLDIIDKTDYTLIAKYDGFDLVDADESSLRITMVLKCPTTL